MTVYFYDKNIDQKRAFSFCICTVEWFNVQINYMYSVRSRVAVIVYKMFQAHFHALLYC